MYNSSNVEVHSSQLFLTILYTLALHSGKTLKRAINIAQVSGAFLRQYLILIPCYAFIHLRKHAVFDFSIFCTVWTLSSCLTVQATGAYKIVPKKALKVKLLRAFQRGAYYSASF